MDSCIYILYWDINKPYIGQTTNFHTRSKRHINEIKKGIHCNYKIQEQFNKFKVDPHIEVLEYCKDDELNYLEELYIIDFNSIKNGLNIISGGYSVGKGIHNHASKYSEEQLVEAYKLLSNYTNSYKHISSITGIPINTIKKIGQGVQHHWLQETYPELYEKIKDSGKLRYKHSASAINQNKKYRNIMSPTGKVFTVLNTLEFSKEHNLPNGNLCSVLLGKRNSVKGWVGID